MQWSDILQLLTKSEVKKLEDKFPGIIEYFCRRTHQHISRFLDHSIQSIKAAEISSFVKKLKTFENVYGEDARFLTAYVELYWTNDTNELLLKASRIREKYPAIFGGIAIDKQDEYIQQVNFYNAHAK